MISLGWWCTYIMCTFYKIGIKQYNLIIVWDSSRQSKCQHQNRLKCVHVCLCTKLQYKVKLPPWDGMEVWGWNTKLVFVLKTVWNILICTKNNSFGGNCSPYHHTQTSMWFHAIPSKIFLVLDPTLASKGGDLKDDLLCVSAHFI